MFQIHTGLQHKVIYAPQAFGLPLKERTLPEGLKQGGYETHIVGKWHLGFFKEEYLPTNRGFDSFYGKLMNSFSPPSPLQVRSLHAMFDMHGI